MTIIKSCPKCKSSNLAMKIRGNEKDIMKANMVELRCDSCGAWLKWVPKKTKRLASYKQVASKLKHNLPFKNLKK